MRASEPCGIKSPQYSHAHQLSGAAGQRADGRAAELSADPPDSSSALYQKPSLADPFQIDKKVTVVELLVWAIALGGLLSLLLLPMNENSSIFTTNYTLSC
jgi:hypothetical protein